MNSYFKRVFSYTNKIVSLDLVNTFFLCFFICLILEVIYNSKNVAILLFTHFIKLNVDFLFYFYSIYYAFYHNKLFNHCFELAIEKPIFNKVLIMLSCVFFFQISSIVYFRLSCTNLIVIKCFCFQYKLKFVLV